MKFHCVFFRCLQDDATQLQGKGNLDPGELDVSYKRCELLPPLCAVLLPVGLVHRQCRTLHWRGFRISKLAPVFLTAVLEYLVAEVLECAGGQIRFYNLKIGYDLYSSFRRLSRKNFINPRMIRLAIDTDQEFRTLLANVDIVNGGGRVLEILPKNSVGNICKRSVEKYVEISEDEEINRTDTEPRSRKAVQKSIAKSSQRNKSRKKKSSLVEISLISDEESDNTEEARRTETVFLARPFQRVVQETSPHSAVLPCSRYSHHNRLWSKKQTLKSDKQKSVIQGKTKFMRIVQLSNSDDERQYSDPGERDNVVFQLPKSLQKSSSGVNNSNKKKQSKKFKYKSAASKKKQLTGIDVSIVISSDDDSEEGKLKFPITSRERKCERRNHSISRKRVTSSTELILIE